MAKGIGGKLGERIRLYGLPTVLKRIVKRAMAKAGYYQETFYFCSFDLAKTYPVKPLPEGFSYKVLSLNDLEHAAGLSFSDEKLTVFRERFAKDGYTGVGIFDGKKLVGLAWMSLNRLETPFPQPANGSISLSPDEGYLLDAFSHPDYRGKGFHPFYTSWRYNQLRDLGKKYAITIIDKDNRAARTTQAKNGFVAKKKIIATKFLGNWKVVVKETSEPLGF
ncbi:hypothetical protein [Flavihumibacter petaseus]|uniref:Putative acyltransferase n=1 Tax=Flavihumibacter petaseus NBRC 106054 TaxID=1220578 RepID=A0A0E9N2T3_9BACT|nr:hypothetical protein [Flavihumibacter petaseus]GAO44327.1 putative acyltransferase [Flavihumibacter petaseus NBRC 106054]